jgi:hypothetical protein
MAINPSLTVTSDFTKKFNDAIQSFKRDSVLVGIPASDNERDQESDEESGPIGNAAILAINHFGSEDAHIPPRPVLAIGIKNAQEAIAIQFKIAAQQVLSKGPAALSMYYERAGIIASNACKKVINDQDHLKPPSPATLAARKYVTKSGFKGKKALLVTGQLRNAITYVVKSIWGNG